MPGPDYIDGDTFVTNKHYEKVTVTVQGNTHATVYDVQKTQQYVLHSVTLHSGTVCIGDTVTLLVDKVCF